MLMEVKLIFAGVGVLILSRVMRYFKNRIKDGFIKKAYNGIYEWVEVGWSAIFMASFFMYFFIQAFAIPSGSMRTTLLEGDHLFVNKFIYGFHIPFSDGKRILPIKKVNRGQIIVFECPPSALSFQEREEGTRKDFIKRCIALGGDTVEVKDKKVFVNGNKIKEDYVDFKENMVYPGIKVYSSNMEYERAWVEGQFANMSTHLFRDNFGPVKVPEGYYFVLGDNRDRSFDSRFWGPVPDNLIKGKPLIIYWPINRIRIM